MAPPLPTCPSVQATDLSALGPPQPLHPAPRGTAPFLEPRAGSLPALARILACPPSRGQVPQLWFEIMLGRDGPAAPHPIAVLEMTSRRCDLAPADSPSLLFSSFFYAVAQWFRDLGMLMGQLRTPRGRGGTSGPLANLITHGAPGLGPGLCRSAGLGVTKVVCRLVSAGCRAPADLALFDLCHHLSH